MTRGIMGRSINKGPYIDPVLNAKIQKLKGLGKKEVVKTWARDSMVSPEFVGYTIAVHNGRTHVPIFISESMVGHYLGEFSLTRTFKGHGKVVARELTKT